RGKQTRWSKLHPKTFLRTRKSAHAIIIVEIPKLPGEMSDLQDFDHVFEFNWKNRRISVISRDADVVLRFY
ncbi:hypothetical protein L9F63_018057, partial [Diploptera punctata]